MKAWSTSSLPELALSRSSHSLQPATGKWDRRTGLEREREEEQLLLVEVLLGEAEPRHQRLHLSPASRRCNVLCKARRCRGGGRRERPKPLLSSHLGSMSSFARRLFPFFYDRKSDAMGEDGEIRSLAGAQTGDIFVWWPAGRTKSGGRNPRSIVPYTIKQPSCCGRWFKHTFFTFFFTFSPL